MNIDDAIQHAMGEWFGDRSVTATYNGAAIPARVRYGENLGNEYSSSTRAEATLWVRKSDVSNPEYKDPVSFGGENWKVVRILKGDGLVWELEVERDVRPTFKR